MLLLKSSPPPPPPSGINMKLQNKIPNVNGLAKTPKLPVKYWLMAPDWKSRSLIYESMSVSTEKVPVFIPENNNIIVEMAANNNPTSTDITATFISYDTLKKYDGKLLTVSYVDNNFVFSSV
jgi:hypothetical protein